MSLLRNVFFVYCLCHSVLSDTWVAVFNMYVFVLFYPVLLLFSRYSFIGLIRSASMGQSIGSIFWYVYPTRCNVTRFIYFWKLLYIFRLLSPPIIRSTYNCIYSSNPSTIAAGSSYGLTSARCCRYSCMCSWWWVEITTETCRAVSRNK